MKTITRVHWSVGIATLVAAAGLSGTAMGAPIDLSGWTTEGNSGTSGADGVVDLSPFGSSEYGWISTANGVDQDGLGAGNETTGSLITSPNFSAGAGDELSFYFNYVTSDGGTFTDYAWAQILPVGDDPIQLFSARTTPEGNTVPGFNLPEPDVDVTLDPEETPVIGGAPDWSPLGDSSGSCWDEGCGYTDWLNASYEFEDPGEYALEFGVVNWNDTQFQSGLAFDGATIEGEEITAPVPAPGALSLMAVGFAAMGLTLRRRPRNLY
ncbi:NF038132 family protein [Halorhodospira sp. 9621]|uniref:NF038132 family protein n=1 Tax=Halorhodospira TaxID=85108 RepID=UPI001EE7DFBE|nr:MULTISPECIES: NF038132 family protein [Halorhodospira]MCG5527921.1 NF038132 family protein [Halorhodospira halophila]MCG5533249.1 NF038132 family protein [Halorhodospira sp. 9621]MCG5542209.1 NF038132 family protein [Halorhodospira sp. 9628]